MENLKKSILTTFTKSTIDFLLSLDPKTRSLLQIELLKLHFVENLIEDDSKKFDHFMNILARIEELISNSVPTIKS